MTVARDMHRSPSELMGIGRAGFSIKLHARGWRGRFVQFSGIAFDMRPGIMAEEYQDMLALYQIEAEEIERERALKRLQNG